jgi:E3 ubiquitin-protein ligase RNF5
MERKNYIECFICMDAAKRPVVSQCGHIYCWKCINQWLVDKSLHCCPVCRNGIELKKLIPLYADGNDNNGGGADTDGLPKVERREPVVNDNRPGFVNNIC